MGHGHQARAMYGLHAQLSGGSPIPHAVLHMFAKYTPDTATNPL